MPTPYSGHGKLWFKNPDGDDNGHLGYLQAQRVANSYAWTTWMAKLNSVNNPPTDREQWQYALKWKVTGDNADKTQAIAHCNTFITNASSMSYNLADPGNAANGLYYRFTMRMAAMFYDWLYDYLDSTQRGKLRDIMLASTCNLFDQTEVFNTRISSTTNFEINDPYSNHHANHMLGATYVAIALSGEFPASGGDPALKWHWPPGDAVEHDFAIPFDNGSNALTPPDLTQYRNLWNWVIDRMEQVILPAWDVTMAGGGHPEGFGYGAASWKHLGEAFILIDRAAGTTYMADHPCFRNGILNHIYMAQSDQATTFFVGDYQKSVSVAKSGWMNADDIIKVAFLTEGVRGTDESGYGQFWLDNLWDKTNSELKLDTLAGYFFLVYRNDTPGVDYRGAIPLYYFDTGSGIMSSRTSWASDAIIVSTVCAKKMKEHQHCDANHLQIWSGTARAVVKDAAESLLHLGSNDPEYIRNSHGHNTYTLWIKSGTDSYPYGWSGGPVSRFGVAHNTPSPSMTRYCASTKYAYSQGTADAVYVAHRKSPQFPTSQQEHNLVLNVYDTNGYGNTPEFRTVLSDKFTRETVHFLPGFVITFDRFRVKGIYNQDDTFAQARWHYPVDPVVAGTPSITRVDVYSTRTFRRTMMATNGYQEFKANEVQPISGNGTPMDVKTPASPSVYQHIVTHKLASADTYAPRGATPCWREEINLQLSAANGGYGRYCNVFEVTTTATPSMTPMVPTPIAGQTFKNGPTGGFTMAGVTIQPPQSVYYHFLFSEQQDASTPSSIDYVAGKTLFGDGVTSGDLHRVYNLVPSQAYLLKETRLFSSGGGITGYYWYHLEPNAAGRITANSAGVAEFRVPKIRRKKTKLTPDEVDPQYLRHHGISNEYDRMYGKPDP